MSLFDMCCPRKPKKSLDYVIKWVEDTDKTVKELEVWKNTIDSNISELVTEAIEKYPWNTLPDEALSHKADKVENATDGHFASLDSNGNLQDSNYNYNSFAPSTHSHSEIKAPGAFASSAYARIYQPQGSVPAFELKVGGANDMSAQVEVNVNNIENLRRALTNPSTTVPEDDDTKLITSKAVYNYSPRAISNAGYGVSVDEDGEIHIGSDYVVIGVDGCETEINSENIDNLNRALTTPSSIPENNANKLITSKAVYDALAGKAGIYNGTIRVDSAGNNSYPIPEGGVVQTALDSFVKSAEQDKMYNVLAQFVILAAGFAHYCPAIVYWSIDSEDSTIIMHIHAGDYRFVATKQEGATAWKQEKFDKSSFLETF